MCTLTRAALALGRSLRSRGARCKQPVSSARRLRGVQGEASRTSVALNVAVLVIGVGCAISGTAASVGALLSAS